jgi:hypothetical protein
MRVVEVLRSQRNLSTSSHEGRAPLELLEGDVDAGVAEGAQRRLETLRFHQPTEVAELAAGDLQEASIWAARVPVDAALHESEKVLPAPCHALPDDLPGPLESHLLSEKGR